MEHADHQVVTGHRAGLMSARIVSIGRLPVAQHEQRKQFQPQAQRLLCAAAFECHVWSSRGSRFPAALSSLNRQRVVRGKTRGMSSSAWAVHSRAGRTFAA